MFDNPDAKVMEIMSKHPLRKSGLILLVVLSMLTLFSLLAITYVVFSSQSRTSSMGMARRDHHRMQQDRLLDYSLQQVLRGSNTDSLSTIGQHSLLADVYGQRQSLAVTNTVSRARFTTGGDRAEFFESRFLRIPLDRTLGVNGITPPDEHDVLTGRVLTFMQGPLRNISFRIVRSLGLTSNPAIPELNHSVVVDLMEASQSRASLQDWISVTAPALCQNATTNMGYAIRINDRETNGLGFGIDYDGVVEMYSGMPVNFLPRNLATTGDTDESYDAADYNDWWLAHRRSGAITAENILPSFHRAALINYIVNSEDISNTTTFTEADFLVMLDQIERACPRPLGISVVRLQYATPNFYSSRSRDFSGSNLGAATTPPTTPTLDIDLRGQWTNWTVPPTPGGQSPMTAFINFVRFLTTGPWDVDNDGDGVPDSVWVDLDLPLMTSPEGKLLKMLTAYYIVDLDSRLDLNAVGNLHQTTDATYTPSTTNAAFSPTGVAFPQGFGAGPAESSLRHLFASDADYTAFLESRYGGTNGTPGEGLSTAIATLVDDHRSRLDGGSNVFNSSTATMENAGTRERRQTVRHDQLPGVSAGIRGAEALGFDRLGNPLLARGSSPTIADQGVDDPYEFRLLETSHSDLPYTIADWERIYRKYDWDISTLPRRLKPFTLLENNVHAVAPRSAHMRNIPLTALSSISSNPIDSLYELIVRIGQRRTTVLPPSGNLTSDMFRELFPFEFGRGMAMDLNRPFGNGIDDDMDYQIDEPEELLKNRIDDNGDGNIDEDAEQDVLLHRQKSPYVLSGATQLTSINEHPTFGLGYASGDNLDPQYEAIVATQPVTARRHHGLQSRQLLARNLYCLAMLLLPDDLYLSNGGGVASTGDDRARAIAQWAVNVIDFRDADHAMTRFPYDPQPFQIQGSETTYWVPNADNSTGLPNGEVVWGMEQPELLMTENLAIHDTRIKDTSDDSTGRSTTSAVNPDDDYDQYRIPEGSLFLEFFCPRTTSTAADSTVPGTGSGLYRAGATNVELNMSALSPSDGTTNYPVWRVALTTPGTTGSTGSSITHQLPINAANVGASGLRFDTKPISAMPPPETPPPIDRILWFTNTTNVTDVAAAAVGLPATVPLAARPAHVFGNENAGTLSIQGGQYLVVGPRQVTYFGSQQDAGTANTNLPNNHRIVLENSTITSGTLPAPANSWANIYTASNDRVVKRTTTMRDSVSMVASTAAPWPSAGTRLNPRIGINVSEPIAIPGTYYQVPTQSVNSNNNAAAPNGALGFGDPTTNIDGYRDYGTAVGQLPDTPFDADAMTPIGGAYSLGYNVPGTQIEWCTAYLQRLADPERPWHAVFNPYITVDWMPIDLTVFSGEDSISSPFSRFGTRQKNGMIGTTRGTTFLSDDTDPPLATTEVVGSTNYFKHELNIDNATNAIPAFPQIQRPTANNAASTNFATLGYLNSPYLLLNEAPGTVATVPPIYLGSPSSAPLNLSWFNRPFASPYELMLVPLSAPGQLTQEFAPPATSAAVATAPNPYSSPTSLNVFTHLPNFFQPRSDSMNSASINYAASTMFELVTTPSQWSDADVYIPPANLSSVTPANARAFTAIGSLVPPYNRVSKMVERGRLNINNVSEEAAWKGVEWNYMNPLARATIGSTNYWASLLQARRIYTATGGGNIPSSNANLNPGYPTEFPGVFKSQFSVGLPRDTVRPGVPTTRGTVLDADGAFNGALTAATLLRKRAAPDIPLFNIRTDVGGANAAHAFNEYLPITRLANLTTNRSNVFAIYMTIGYFEFDPSTGLTQEYGWDNGKTRRHRGFYVVDRSIPVAFEPGVDHNTDNCVLMRRIIE